MPSSDALALVDADPAAPITTSGDDHQWMSFIAGLLSAVDCGGSFATSHVHQMRNGLQVIGSDAVPNSAQVIQLGVIRDRADEEFVGDSVGTKPSSLAGLITVAPDDAVASTVESTSPEPTSIGLVDLLPEAVNEGNPSGSSHGYMVSTIHGRGQRTDSEI